MSLVMVLSVISGVLVHPGAANPADIENTLSDVEEEVSSSLSDSPNIESNSKTAAPSGMVIAGGQTNGNHSVAAFDSQTGDELWNTTFEHWTSASPVVVDNNVYIGSQDDGLRSLNATDGSVNWNFTGNDDFYSSPVVVDDTVYAVTDAGTIYSIDRSNGNQTWKNDFGAASSIATPHYYDGTLYVGGSDGTMRGFNATDGSQEFSFSTGAEISGSATATGDVLYFTSEDGNAYAVDLSNGNEVWNTSIGASSAAPLVDNGTVYVGADVGDFYALDASDGSTIWNFSSSTDGFPAGATIYNGRVFVGSTDGFVYAIDAENGTEEWSYDTAGDVKAVPTVKDGTVYITGQKANKIYGFEASTGNVEMTGSISESISSPTFVGDGETQSSGSRTDQRVQNYYIVASAGADNSITVTVRDTNGNPVPGATVYSATFNHDNYSGTLDEIEAEIARIDDELSDIKPDGWEEQQRTPFSITGERGVLQSNTVGVAVHTKAEWDEPELGKPGVKFDADDTLVFSAWGPECGNVLIRTGYRDAYENDLAGVCVQDDHKIVYEQIGPNGTVLHRTIDGTQSYQENFATADHEVAIDEAMATGFYRVYPQGHEEAAYYISVGDPEKILMGWEDSLEDRQDKLSDRADRIRSLKNDGKLQSFTNTTNENGKVKITYPSNVDQVKLVAYKTPGDLGKNADFDDARDYYYKEIGKRVSTTQDLNIKIDDYLGAVYVSDSFQSPRVKPDETDEVTAGVRKAPLPPWTDRRSAEEFADFFDEYLANNSLGFDGHNYSVENVTELLNIRDKYGQMVSNSDKASEIFCDRNTEWCRNGTPDFDPIDPDDITYSGGKRLIRQVGELAHALRNAPVSLNVGDAQTDISNRTRQLTEVIALPSPPGKLGDVNATVVFKDGSQTEISSEYLTLDPLVMLGAESVLLIEEWPVPDGKEISRLKVSLADSKVTDVSSSISDSTTELDTNIELPAEPNSLDDVDAVVVYDDGSTDTLSNSYLSLTSDTINGPENILKISGFSVPDGKTVNKVDVSLAAKTGETVDKSLEQTLWLNTEIPFSAPGGVDWAEFGEDDVTVIMHSQGGETTTLDSNYWRVEPATLGAGSPRVVIEDYPLDPDVAVKKIEVIVVGEGGVGRATSRIKNPGFSGEVPSIESIDASTLYPGPNNRVEVRLNPEEPLNFGSITNATVTGPDGSAISSNITNGVVTFTTAGEGNHRVKITYTNADGDEFASVFTVKGQPKELPGPPTMIARSGTNGLYAVAGEDLEGGSFDKEGVSGVIAEAVIASNAEPPDQIDIHATEIDDSAKGPVTIRVVRGDNRQTVRSNVDFTYHSSSIPEDAHVYIGGCPVPKSGNSCGDWEVNGTKAVISGETKADGSQEINVIRDPTLLDEVRWRYSKLVHAIDIPLVGSLSVGDAAAAIIAGGIPLIPIGLLARRRRGETA